MSILLGCGGSGGSAAPDCDVPALLTDKCGGSVCHGPQAPAAALDLVSTGVGQRVANVPGEQCLGLLADPSNPTGSVLYQKVADAPTCGARMPLYADPLDERELTCLRDWISGLLPPQADEPDAGADCPECACEPNRVASCYDGPMATLTAPGTSCVAGTRQCAADGLSWGPCQGQVLPAGEDCTTPADEDCDGLTPACRDAWSLGFGSFMPQDTADMKDSQSARSVAVDSQGNIILLGDFEGTVSFGGEYLTATELKSDVVLAKYDRHGNHLMSKRFGDSSNQFGTQVAVDGDDNIILVGRMLGSMDFGGPTLSKVGYFDIFVVKLDPMGNHLWSWNSRGGHEERADRVVIDSAGDVLITGKFNETIRFGTTTFSAMLSPDGVIRSEDAFVAKLDGDTGEPKLAVYIGGRGNDSGAGIAVNAAGAVFVTGYFGDSVTIGDETLTTRGGKDIFFARLSADGDVAWARSYGSTGDDQPHDLALGPDGDLVMVGTAGGDIDLGGDTHDGFGQRDMLLAKYSQGGDHLWSALYGDAGDQLGVGTLEDNTAFALDIDTGDDIYIAGPLVGTLRFDGGQALSSDPAEKSDIFFAKLSASGSYITGSRYGRTGTDIGLDVAGLGDSVVVAGRHFSSSLDFGPAGTITGYGSSDGFVAKLPLP